MWIFNSLLLLIKTTSSSVYGGKEAVRRDLKHKFIDLLKTGDKLPKDFCIDVFLKYLMFD
jgi:hypothetical protein